MNHTAQQISQNTTVLIMEFPNGFRKQISDKEFCLNFEIKHQYKLEDEILMFKTCKTGSPLRKIVSDENV